MRQRLATCHNETRNTGSTQTSELQESASATASDPNTACSEARTSAANRAMQECSSQQGRTGAVRVLNQRMGNSVSSPNMGRVTGQLLGNSLFGQSGLSYNYNSTAQYQCITQIAAGCARTSTSARSVEVCQ